MNKCRNPFDSLPSLKETIARIARARPENAPAEANAEFTYVVTDEHHKISYTIISPKRLTAADIRRALVRSFSRTDAWPDERGRVNIRL
jgi:hypothetical protein